MNTINKMKFTNSHEWVSLDDNVATVGITDYAQKLLGDIVYLELPKLEQVVQKGNAVGVIESVKSASDIYSPLDGVIVAINQNAIDNTSLINTSAYTDGWLFKIQINNTELFNQLMDHDSYMELTKK